MDRGSAFLPCIHLWALARCPLDRIVQWQRHAYETPEDFDAVHGGVLDMKLRFDRGTILLTEPLHDVNLVEAPGVLWDPRVSAHRAPASRYPALRSWLREAGVEFEDIAALPRLTPDAWSTVTLRPYQEAALSAWELAQHRGVVALPTGSGKTRLAIAAIRRTGLSALCLVPTRVLLDQWSREITTVYGGAIGRYGDGARQMAPLTVATFESAYRHMARLGDRFDLLIVDEVHHFGSGLRDEALEMMVAHARLGLTATPPREAAVVNRLAELVGPIVFELAVGDLAGGFLASFDAITLHLELSPEERSAYSALHALFTNVHTEFRQLAPGASWADWSRHAGRSAEGRRALTAWRQMRGLLAFTHAKRRALRSLLERHRSSRTLVFTADNDTAYAIAREHLVMPLTCDIGRHERDDALERFRRGQIRTLVSARVLNEGLDVPDADVAVVVGGALGEREHVQRVGRLLRPGEGKRALVYELVTRNTIEVGQARRRRQGLVARSSAQL
jgi:superfamily II DNA or RNA helicase